MGQGRAIKLVSLGGLCDAAMVIMGCHTAGCEKRGGGDRT